MRVGTTLPFGRKIARLRLALRLDPDFLEYVGVRFQVFGTGGKLIETQDVGNKVGILSSAEPARAIAGMVVRMRSNRSPTVCPLHRPTKVSPASAAEPSPPIRDSEWHRAHSSRKQPHRVLPELPYKRRRERSAKGAVWGMGRHRDAKRRPQRQRDSAGDNERHPVVN